MSTPDSQTPIDPNEAGIDPQVVLRGLATSVALLPQEGPTPDDAPEGALAIPVIEQDEKQYVPVFTSEESLVAAGADPATALRVSVADLAASLGEQDLWLAVDPANEDGLAIPPEVVHALPSLAAAPGGEPDGGGAPA
jgi:hypothetical protein